MKLSLIVGLLSVTCGAASSFGQGTIILDNYNSVGPFVTYGSPGIPANGVSGASGIVGLGVGSGLLSGWTFGLYYALGDVRGSIGIDPTGFNFGDPSTFGGGLTLATGSGSTAPFDSIVTDFVPGTFI